MLCSISIWSSFYAYIKSISISGYRGFSIEQEIPISIPNGTNGSGLTTIVGSNNSGKTSMIEAVQLYNVNPTNISFSEGKRNKKTNGIVKITYCDDKDKKYSIESVSHGGSNVQSTNESDFDNNYIPYVLQSRRSVNVEFHRSFNHLRSDYVNNTLANRYSRTATLENFQDRIHKWQENKEEFDKLLYKIVDKNLDWHIEQKDNQLYYISYGFGNNQRHSSEGIGDGIWSIFTIVDALYDSKDGSIIIIDEPELSIHPQYQKKVMDLLMEFSKSRQIIISTHSTYFINWNSVINGGSILRFAKNINAEINVYTLNNDAISFIKSVVNDYQNARLIGLEAKEIFFLEDNVIVVEGQDDVYGYKKVANDLNIQVKGDYYGWGSGGASKIQNILNVLETLGYKKVVAIFDGDQSESFELCREVYGDKYHIVIISKDDIRDKEEKKQGLLTSNFSLKDESSDEIDKMFLYINKYFESVTVEEEGTGFDE